MTEDKVLSICDSTLSCGQYCHKQADVESLTHRLVCLLVFAVPCESSLETIWSQVYTWRSNAYCITFYFLFYGPIELNIYIVNIMHCIIYI